MGKSNMFKEFGILCWTVCKFECTALIFAKSSQTNLITEYMDIDPHGPLIWLCKILVRDSSKSIDSIILDRVPQKIYTRTRSK